MRPVVKLSPGIYTNSDGSQIEIKSSYSRYQEAKSALIFNLGQICSYCEQAYHQDRDLAVEHVQPKSKYDSLKAQWSNFLLSCGTCNGRDNKGTKEVVLEECHLPHLNNTFKSLVYKAGGVVEVNPSLSGNAFTHAKNLLDLVGLGKSPETSAKGDTRWKERQKVWELAERYKKQYETGTLPIETIIDLVKARGGWSIWFTVFKRNDEVRKALLDFPGTAKDCFDEGNHYEPIDRNPESEDPT